MNILTQFKDFINNNFENLINDLVGNFNSPYSIKTYEQFAVEFDKFTASLTIECYEQLISNLDEQFMHSNIRKQLYDSKGFVTKPLLTKFGLINFKRRRYVNKDTKVSYMFVDRFLGLVKYSRMDPFVISDLCEEATTNSYSKAGKNVSKSIGTKIKYEDDPNKYIISRATARNNVIKASVIIEEPTNDEVKEVEVLNVMLDEKFVGSQFNNDMDHMIKSAVIFEGTELVYKNRTRLTGKRIFGSIEDDLLIQVVDYIYYNYDTDKLKTINFMGDGALWIKSFSFNSFFKYNKDILIKFGLDHFHLAQAIQHIVTNKYKDSFGKVLTDYVIHNKKEDFITVCNSIIEFDEKRMDTINKKKEYILNNWDYIQTSFHDIKYKCSMESNISHVFADIFTSRPKAYSKNGLKSLLKLRLLKINGYDIKRLYIDSLNKIKEAEKLELLEKKLNLKKDSKYIESLNIEIPILQSSIKTSNTIRALINSCVV